MPRDLFGQMTRPFEGVGARSRLTVPLSLAAHALAAVANRRQREAHPVRPDEREVHPLADQLGLRRPGFGAARLMIVIVAILMIVITVGSLAAPLR